MPAALIALDRNDRTVWAMLRNAADDTAAGVGARRRDRTGIPARRKPPSAHRTALAHCDEVPLDGPLARASGLLCGRAATPDIVDASVALIAAARSRTGPTAIVTSDPTDLRHLLQTIGAPVRLVAV